MNLSAIDLNLLLVLHTVLEEKSVAGAARKLHVTPPAVSNALGRLREVLGDPLLVRRGRGLVPTPRALEIAPKLAAAFSEIALAVDEEARFDAQTSRRRFVLACSDVEQICSVPAVAARFARELPAAALQIVSIDQLTASDGLAAGTIDCAFAPAQADLNGLHGEIVGADEPVIVLRRDHPIRSKRLTRAQFNRLRHIDVWLVLGRAGVGNRLTSAFLEKHGLRREIAVIVPGFVPAAMVAATTDMAAGMPLRVAEALAQSHPIRVARLPKDLPPAALPLMLVWHPRTHTDPGSIAFRRLVIEAVRPSFQPSYAGAPA